MRDGAVQTGENRYRETFGRYFEDFEIGDVYEHRPGRTISEADKKLINQSKSLIKDLRDLIDNQNHYQLILILYDLNSTY